MNDMLLRLLSERGAVDRTIIDWQLITQQLRDEEDDKHNSRLWLALAAITHGLIVPELHRPFVAAVDALIAARPFENAYAKLSR